MARDEVELVVQLTAPVARRFTTGMADAAAEAPAQAVEAALKRQGATLSPMHPNASDPSLRDTFVVAGLSAAGAEGLAAELRGKEAVVAAYVQPRPTPA